MAAIMWNLDELGRNFALYFGTTKGICMQSMIGTSVLLRMLVHVKYDWNICKIEDARSCTMIQAHILDPAMAAAQMYKNIFRSYTTCET